jgi:hypothetical protein
MGEANGYRSTGDGLFAGENRSQGAIITYYLKDAKEKVKTSIKVFDSNNTLIRTITHTPKKGMNRTNWDLDAKGIRFPDTKKPGPDAEERGGYNIGPGVYKVTISHGDFSESTDITVKVDPNIPATQEQISAKIALYKRHYENVNKVTDHIDKIREALGTLDRVNKVIKDQSAGEKFKTITSCGDSIKQKIQEFLDRIEAPEIQGFTDHPELITEQLQNVQRYLQSTLFPVTKTQLEILETVEKNVQPFIAEIDNFLNVEWISYRRLVERTELSFFEK